jgi:hypothetical protein
MPQPGGGDSANDQGNRQGREESSRVLIQFYNGALNGVAGQRGAIDMK